MAHLIWMRQDIQRRRQAAAGAVLFADDFSSGDLTAAGPNGGFFWASDASWPADGGAGLRVSVLEGFSHRGDVGHCLRFNFAGAAATMAEQRFTFGGVAYPEVWLRYYIYLPDGTEAPSLGPRVSRTAGGNNKFLRLYGVDESSPRFGSELFTTSPAGDEVCNMEAAINPAEPTAIGGIEGATDVQLVNDANRGRWVKVEWHCKPSTSADTPNGELRCWLDDVLVSEVTGIQSLIAGGSMIGGGYLFGSQNAGYEFADTQIYLSGFAVSITGRVPD